MGLLAASNSVCLASSSKAGTRREGGMDSFVRLKDSRREKGARRSFSQLVQLLVMSNGEHNNSCKHSVGRGKVCKNVHDGTQRRLAVEEGPR